MFGKKKNDKPLVFDIRRKPVKGFLGNTKWVPVSRREQRAMKERLMAQYPGGYFIDDLHDRNSVRPQDDLMWIDRIEMWDALLGE